MTELLAIYEKLLDAYGPQGWFPLIELHGSGGSNPTKSGSVEGYHPGDYSYPKTRLQQFEICVGLILTQNTNWVNVEKALLGLVEQDALCPEKLVALPIDTLKECIRPAGYYNQKAKKLHYFAEFFVNHEEPTREQLLSIWGVGPETADSMLLYAYKFPEFIVDAYTRRFCLSLDLVSEKYSYDEVKHVFVSQLPKELIIYQEFHALIVEHAKRMKDGTAVPL